MASTVWDDILATAGRRFEDVEVPEWGRSVRVWSLSALDLVEYIAKRAEFEAEPSSRAVFEWILVRCLGSAAGGPPAASERERLGQFLGALGPRSLGVLARLSGVALRLSGSTEEAAEEIRGN